MDTQENDKHVSKPSEPSINAAATATKAFLASPTRMAQVQGIIERKGLRWEAWLAAGEMTKNLFVAEFCWPDVNIDNMQVIDIATLLLGQVRQTDAFICLLSSDSTGKQMELYQTALSTTFFELELFQAIVLERPIYLLVSNSFDPTAIGPYLDLLEFGLPNWRERVRSSMSDSEILHAIAKIRRGQGAPWKVARGTASTANLYTGLLYARDRFVRGEIQPKIHFLQLNRQSGPNIAVEPNLAAIADLIHNRRTFEQEDNNDRRLAFSWLLARELMATPLLNTQGEVLPRDPLILSAWNTALQDWHGAASWMGLHSNIHLGTLPALDTLDAVRQVLRKNGPEDAYGNVTQFPGGAYASSYYSLAKRVAAGKKQFVLTLAQKMLRSGWGDERTFLRDAGNLAMMGSIALEAGHAQEAVQHFETMVELRRASDATPRSMGEALCELAFARLIFGQRTLAAAQSKEGVDLMRTPNADGQFIIDGFLVRAMFKTAAIYLSAGKIAEGKTLYKQALGYAKEKHLDDQLRQWQPSALLARGVRVVWQQIHQRFVK